MNQTIDDFDQEYALLKGDLFREIFGGNLVGVRRRLQFNRRMFEAS